MFRSNGIRVSVLARTPTTTFVPTGTTRWVHIRGRLSPGVGLAQASAAVSGVTSRLAKQYPATNELTAGIAKAYDPIGNLQRPQFRILEAVALTLTGTVLLVVCLNISGMMQVRSAMRERELSIRQAIGASRGRLVQHLLSEAIVLAGLGGALGSVVLFNIPSVLSWWVDQPLPVQVQEALRVDLSIDRDLCRALPCDQRGVRIPVGHSIQSSGDHLLPEG